jgi:DNA-binding winged helix-turn-helix (wHTH) protein
VDDVDRTSRVEIEPPHPSGERIPVLTILQGKPIGLTLRIENDRTIIGRGSRADLVLKDDLSSRQHAQITRSSREGAPCHYYLKDLGSTNGTFLNGTTIVASELLSNGDKIKIGGHLLKFSLLDQMELDALLKLQPGEAQKPRPGSEELLCFASFSISVDVDLLYRDDCVVPLEPRAVRVLRYLVEHHDRVVSKEELLEAVWPEVFTTEGVLKKAVSQARRALSDNAQSARFIQTYHRRGYRFIAPVQRRVRQHT